MTTLVTGAGLIGTAFARCALERGERVVFFDPEPREAFLRFNLGEGDYSLERQDVRDLPALVEATKRNGAQTIVHTAGLIGSRVQRSLRQGFDVNVGGACNVGETARLCGLRRVVYVSTFGVYDRRLPQTKPIDEDFPRGGARAYGNSKAASELLLAAYADAHKFELVILRPANVFGYGHFWAGSSGGRKIQSLMEAGLAGTKMRFDPADAFDNEYIYARDVGRAVDLAVSKPTIAEPRIFNIGSGVVTPFAELVAAARRVFPGLEAEFPHDISAGGKGRELDISRAARALDWRPSFTLTQAFRDYAQELGRASAEL